MATMKTLNGYGFNATELNGKAPEYYIQPRNLLDNSDFRNPVNQRGATSYSGIWAYSIDRWSTWLDASNSATVSVINGGITPYPGMVIQRIESKYIDSSKTYTFAAMTGDGLLVFSGKITTSTDQGMTNTNNGIYFNYDDDSDTYQFTMAGLTNASKFVWAALYEGSYTADTLPPYVPKGYAAELAACNSAPVDVGGGYGGGSLQAYPVGSVYMSFNDTSPASLFGGTWEQLTDRFLLGAGDSYAAGSTGGEAEHTLTILEMPNHAHTYTIPGNEAGTEWYGAKGTAKGAAQTSGASGGGWPHNNMPPYLAVYMWKRVG